MQFYYQQLSERKQQIYRTLKDAVESRSVECFLYDLTLTREQIGDVMMLVLLDYPDYYWTKGNFYIYRENNFSQPRLRIRIVYLFDDRQMLLAESEMQKQIKKCCEAVGRYQADGVREFVLQVCNWVYQNVEYQYTGDKDQTIYSVFCEKKSVCMGISKAAALVLRLFGINSIVVKGKLFGKHPHSWLIVLVNQRYYHLDITLGYPCFDELWQRNQGQPERYCILKDDEWISNTHDFDKRYHYPICGGDV